MPCGIREQRSLVVSNSDQFSDSASSQYARLDLKVNDVSNIAAFKPSQPLGVLNYRGSLPTVRFLHANGYQSID
jgi:hypothetical protein